MKRSLISTSRLLHDFLLLKQHRQALKPTSSHPYSTQVEAALPQCRVEVVPANAKLSAAAAAIFENRTPTQRLKGKVAVVCGAGNLPTENWGIGSATALQFAREGAKVVVASRTEKKVQTLAAAIEAEVGPGHVLPLSVDVSKPVDVSHMLSTTLEKLGSVDILCNAGVYCSKYNGLNKLNYSTWKESINLNLNTQFLLMHNFLPHMVARGGGSIIFVSTIATVHTLGTGKQRLSYSSGKAGAEVATMEVGTLYARKNIRANVVRVGYIDSPLVHRAAKLAGVDSGKLTAERGKYCPSGAQGEPIDVAHACVFLASEESRYITGSSLVVDGGTSFSSPGLSNLKIEKLK